MITESKEMQGKQKMLQERKELKTLKKSKTTAKIKQKGSKNDGDEK